MKIAEFKYRIDGLVQDFVANYHRNHDGAPEDWPLEMPDEEWFEQFTIFLELMHEDELDEIDQNG